jgi:hypothetical protein
VKTTWVRFIKTYLNWPPARGSLKGATNDSHADTVQILAKQPVPPNFSCSIPDESRQYRSDPAELPEKLPIWGKSPGGWPIQAFFWLEWGGSEILSSPQAEEIF